MSDVSGFLTGFSTSLNQYLGTQQKNQQDMNNEVFKNKLAEDSKIKEQAAQQDAEGKRIQADNKSKLDLAGKMSPEMADTLLPGLSASVNEFQKTNNRLPTMEEAQKGMEGVLQKMKSKGEQDDKFYQKEWDKIVTQANPNTARGTNPLGAATLIIDKANTALNTLSKPTMTNQEAGNVMADIASIYQRGSPTQFGMQHQEYTTLYGKVQNAIQSISGKPQDAVPDAIKQRLIADVKELKKLNTGVVKRNLTFIEKAHPNVISKYQDEWNGIKATYDEPQDMTTPASVDGWGIKKL